MAGFSSLKLISNSSNHEVFVPHGSKMLLPQVVFSPIVRVLKLETTTFLLRSAAFFADTEGHRNSPKGLRVEYLLKLSNDPMKKQPTWIMILSWQEIASF